MAVKSTGNTLATLLKTAGRTNTGSKKSTVPQVVVPENISKAVGEWIEHKRAEDTAKAQRESIEAQIRPFASEKRRELCQRDRTVHATVQLVAGEHGSIKVVHVGRFKDMSVDNCENDLRGKFGNDFDKYFQVSLNIKLDESKLTEDDVAGLQKLFGRRFSDIVKMAPVIRPTDAFIQDRLLDPRIAKIADNLESDGLCVPFASSFRE